MPEKDEWDDTLFAGTAAYYRRGRLPYAPGLVAVLGEVLQLDGRGRLLDVGCGPGILALDLAHLFQEVVGLDPDPGMLAEAERTAGARELRGKTRWVRARAEELPAGLGTFTTASFGQSFHWMDRDLVAGTVRDMLRPGGSLVHVADDKSEVRSAEGLPYPAVPHERIDALVRRYLGPDRRAGRGTVPPGVPGNEEEVLARAGFASRERHVVPGGQALERGLDDVVAEVFSMSYSAPPLFGPNRSEFEAELRALLRATSPAGRFSERRPSTEVRIWRKAFA
nr:methyltransferase domain-containing protein [Streptomyces acidipaludis]